jgi:M6 family metalloprotease-like protein
MTRAQKRTAPTSLVIAAAIALFLSILPLSAFSAQKVSAGAPCTKLNAKATANNKTFTCVKKGTKLVWNNGVAIKVAAPAAKPTNSPSPSPDVTPKPSPTPTSTPTPSPTFKTIVYQAPSEPTDNVESCKIKEVSNSRGMTGAGFPAWKSLTPNLGTVKWALIPVEFSDMRGDANFRSRVDEQMKLLSEWYATVSEGKFKVEWVVLNKWVTLPGKASDYYIERSANLRDAANGPKLFKDAMNAADPIFDFTNIRTVNFILPPGQNVVLESSQGFPWDEAVKEYVSKEGPISSFSIPGVFFDQIGREYWSYWAHEFGHAIGLPHVGASRGSLPPFNPFDLMGGQDGPMRELSGWLRFYGTWLPDEKVYCKDSSKVKSVDITLAPLSSSESGLKFTILPITSTKAVMIESRRATKFSCGPKSLNGVLVYTYDATLGHGDNFLLPVVPKDRKAPVAYFYQPCIVESFPDPLLYEGDKVTIEGLTIEVLTSGNYDRIRITKP